MVDDVFEERDVGFDAADAEFAEGAVHAGASFGKVSAPGGDFDEERVVERGDDGTAVGAGAIEADAEAGGGAIGLNFAVVGDEAVGGIFGGDAALKGGAMEGDFVLGGEVHLGAVQGEALGDLDLAVNDINAGDHLGDGVFDLDAGIDFNEEPFAGVGVD